MDSKSIVAKAYQAFNQRDVGAALILMSENVRWPKASEGGFVVGKAEIKAYWSRQWLEFDPRVEPIEMVEFAPGKLEVRVHQLVKSLDGNILFDGEVMHLYTLENSLIVEMALKGSGDGPTNAFKKT